MKNTYYLPALAALLAAAPAARAQQAWQPFRANTTYQYTEGGTPGDTTHTLQVAPGLAVAGAADTLYRFNRRAPKGSRQGNSNNPRDYQLRADNLFGSTLRVQPRAVFTFVAANGRSVVLRPRTALGQNWNAGPNGLTAHVTGRSLAPVPGGGTDSVAAIMFSDGQMMTLSKRHGLLDGPSLDSYLNGRNRRHNLTLTALGGRNGVGALLVGPRAAYNFQPGDLFQRYGVSTYSGSTICSEHWSQDSILSRTLSRTGDTVIYSIRTRSLYRGYGRAGTPAGMGCSATGSSYQATTITMSYSDVATIPAYGASSLTSTLSGGEVSGPASRSSRFLRRAEWEQLFCNIGTSNPNADSLRLLPPLDLGGSTRYGAGLGRTRRITWDGINNSMDEENLVAYRKGPEVWGTFFSIRQLLAARATKAAASTAAFPQPCGADLTVTFDLARPQPVRLALHDALGRTVLTRAATALAAGNQRLVLDTQFLPAGLYTLHLELAGEGRTEVLKVLKAE